jgi:WD40 repeat protein
MTGDVVPGSSSSSLVFWSLAVLNDSTVISGDSLGHIQVWDGIMGVLQQTLSGAHHSGSDVTTVVVSSENSFFSAGSDGKVNSFRRSAATNGQTHGSWFLSQSHHLHSHDVLSLALFKSKQENSHSFLLSGGLDSKLCFYPTEENETENVEDDDGLRSTSTAVKKPFWLPPLDGSSTDGLVSHSLGDDCRTILMRNHSHVDLWRTQLQETSATGGGENTDSIITNNSKSNFEEKCRLLVRLAPSSSSSLCCSALSPNGRLALVCGRNMTRLFFVKNDNNNNNSQSSSGSHTVVKEIPLVSFSSENRTVTAGVFTPDNRQLILWDCQEKSFLLFSLSGEGEKENGVGGAVTAAFTVALPFSSGLLVEKNSSSSSSSINSSESSASLDRLFSSQVKKMTVSPDGKLLAILSCSNTIVVFSLTNK